MHSAHLRACADAASTTMVPGHIQHVVKSLHQPQHGLVSDGIVLQCAARGGCEHVRLYCGVMKPHWYGHCKKKKSAALR